MHRRIQNPVDSNGLSGDRSQRMMVTHFLGGNGEVLLAQSSSVDFIEKEGTGRQRRSPPTSLSHC